MKVIKDTIGSTTVLIQVIDDEIEMINAPQTGRATQTTGIEDKFTHAYTNLRSILKSVVGDISADMKNLSRDTHPTGLELEFGLSLSEEANIWVLKTGGDCTLRVQMTWDFKGQ